MNLFTKHILMLALAVLPGAGLRAQTAGAAADVSATKWSVYVQAGVSGFNGFRGYEAGTYSGSIAPDFKLGAAYHVTDWFRTGVAAGYTKPGTNNTSMPGTTATIQDFKIGGYSGSLTTTSVSVSDCNELNMLFAAATAEFNILPKAKVLNIWLGTGVGAAFGWNYNSGITAVSEEGKAQGDTYFNIYHHNYVVTNASSSKSTSLFVPATASFEFAVSKLVKLSLSGEYDFIFGNKSYTPNGIWAACAGIRFCF